MKAETIKNILAMLERVTVTGKEAVAWVMAHQELQGELQKAEDTLKQKVAEEAAKIPA